MPRNESELQDEVDWAAGRPESQWRDKGTAPPRVDEQASSDCDTAFEAVLTDTEYKWYHRYHEKFPNLVYSLNQDPDVKPMRPTGNASWIRFISGQINPVFHFVGIFSQ